MLCLARPLTTLTNLLADATSSNQNVLSMIADTTSACVLGFTVSVAASLIWDSTPYLSSSLHPWLHNRLKTADTFPQVKRRWLRWITTLSI